MRQLKITKGITNRVDASLDKYLQEIGRIELITAEEEVDLAKKIKEGDEEALKKLVKANLRFVVSVAKQYQNQWLSLPDLINEGNLGLIRSAIRFDETRGFKFISYGVWRIRQAILQAIAEKSRTIKLPLNKIWEINKLNKISERLEQEYERPATSDEIADILEKSVDDVKEMEAHIQRTTSLDSPLRQENSDDGKVIDTIRSTEFKDPDDALMSEWLKKEIASSLSKLTPREEDIIKMYYWLGYEINYTLEEIAVKFELTRERVRQIKEKGLRRLKHPTRSRNLKPYLGQ